MLRCFAVTDSGFALDTPINPYDHTSLLLFFQIFTLVARLSYDRPRDRLKRAHLGKMPYDATILRACIYAVLRSEQSASRALQYALVTPCNPLSITLCPSVFQPSRCQQENSMYPPRNSLPLCICLQAIHVMRIQTISQKMLENGPTIHSLCMCLQAIDVTCFA